MNTDERGWCSFIIRGPMVPELITNRLILRPLRLDDAGQVQQIFPQWDVVRFLNASVPWPFPPDGVFTYYRDVALPAMERGDEWHWTVRPKASPEQIIGSIGLMKDQRHNRGFWLDPAWHEQGLMSEAVFATNDYWFLELGFPLLRVPKAAANVASRRISEKTGMRMVALEERSYVSGRLTTEIWEITADEWRAARSKLLAEIT